MISERDIAEKFSAIWKQNFPLLSPNFVKVFNEAQVSSINSQSVEIDEVVKYDLISEVAFNLSEITLNTKTIASEYLSDKNNLKNLIDKTAKIIWKSGNYTAKDLEISESELEYIIKISSNIEEFVNKIKKETLQFRPKLKGYGFIPDLEADISIDDTLYEVKTVTRNFKSSDLKQLFIYLALKQVSKTSNWKYAGLYNPKRGIYCKFNIKSLIYNLSGGKTPNETFENLLSGLTRDIEIDSKF